MTRVMRQHRGMKPAALLLALVAAGTGCQHHAQRTQSFAARADDVLGNLVDQHDVAGQPLYDGLVDALQVCRDQRPDFFELHSRDKPSGRCSYGKPGMVPIAPRQGNGGNPLSA